MSSNRIVKDTIFLIILTFVFSISLFSGDKIDIEKEKEAVKKVIVDAYVNAIYLKGDAEAIKKGWHEDCNIVIFSNDVLIKNPIKYFINRFERNPGPLNANTTYQFSYVSVAGYAAIAIVEIYYGEQHKYTDYMSLYKFKDGWKIVSKIYYDYDYKPMKERKAIKVDPKIYDEYMGKYEYAPNVFLTIKKENNSLFAVMSEGQKFEIFPETETKYFSKVLNIGMTFIKNEEGKVTEMILHHGERNTPAKKIN